MRETFSESAQCTIQCLGDIAALILLLFFSFSWPPSPPLLFLLSDKSFPANLRWSNCGRTILRGRNTAQALPHVPEKSEVLAGNTYWDNKIVRKAGPPKGHGVEKCPAQGVCFGRTFCVHHSVLCFFFFFLKFHEEKGRCSLIVGGGTVLLSHNSTDWDMKLQLLLQWVTWPTVRIYDVRPVRLLPEQIDHHHHDGASRVWSLQPSGGNHCHMCTQTVSTISTHTHTHTHTHTLSPASWWEWTFNKTVYMRICRGWLHVFSPDNHFWVSCAL